MGVPVNKTSLKKDMKTLKFFYFLQSQEWNDYVGSLSQEEE